MVFHYRNPLFPSSYPLFHLNMPVFQFSQVLLPIEFDKTSISGLQPDPAFAVRIQSLQPAWITLDNADFAAGIIEFQIRSSGFEQFPHCG
jgi:hypothetical protein